MSDKTLTVGLFGTCGNSTWRQPIIELLNQHNIPFFNPQVGPGEWHPGMVAEENAHLREDGIVVFPVTWETTGQGSLAEVGFSIMQAVRSNPSYLIVMIDDECRDPGASEAQIMESNRTRKLVKSKVADLAAQPYSRVLLVETMEEIPALILSTHAILRRMAALEKDREKARKRA